MYKPTLYDLDDAIADMSIMEVTPALKNKLLFVKSIFSTMSVICPFLLYIPFADLPL